MDSLFIKTLKIGKGYNNFKKNISKTGIVISMKRICPNFGCPSKNVMPDLTELESLILWLGGMPSG